MSASTVSNYSNILSFLSIEDSDFNTITAESIDEKFFELLQTVKQDILEQHFEPIADLLVELISKEVYLNENYEEVFLFNNQVFNKLLIYEIHGLHIRIIDLIVEEINNAFTDFKNICQYSPSIGFKMRFATINKFSTFANTLSRNKSIYESVINNYIEIINKKLRIFEI